MVRTHSRPFWCWDKPRATLDSLDSPQPWLEGSHHLPPFSILCVAPLHPCPNGSLSRDSTLGVPKLSRFRLPGLWAIITSRPNLWSGRGLNQSCSSPQELFNAMSHYPISHRDRVDSQLLVVGSQTAILTPGPSFAHNLNCKCPNDSCEVILDIYTSRPFQWYQEHFNARCFDPCNQALSFWESRRTPSPQLWECEFHPHTWPKWGCDRKSYGPLKLQESQFREFWNSNLGVPILGILGLQLGNPKTKWHLGVGPMPKHKEYYKGEGGGFPQVRTMVSLVSPCLLVSHPCTKSAPTLH